MDKETEIFMLAQFKDVLEEAKRILNENPTMELALKNTENYIDMQILNVKSQINFENKKELTTTPSNENS